jgi:hypothetical protein
MMPLCRRCWLSLGWVIVLHLPALQATAQQPAKPAGDNVPGLLEAMPARATALDTPYLRLAKERYNEAVAELKLDYARYRNNQIPVGGVFGPLERVLHSGLAIHEGLRERIAFLSQLLQVVKSVENGTEALVRTGQGLQATVHRARYLRLDVEIRLLQARAQQRTQQVK